jgi:hypothetical protein
LRASGEVTGRDVTRAAVWTGTAAVAEFSPQDLLERFGLPPQQTSDPQAFTRATVNAFTVTKTNAKEQRGVEARRHVDHGHRSRTSSRPTDSRSTSIK